MDDIVHEFNIHKVIYTGKNDYGLPLMGPRLVTNSTYFCAVCTSDGFIKNDILIVKPEKDFYPLITHPSELFKIDEEFTTFKYSGTMFQIMDYLTKISGN